MSLNKYYTFPLHHMVHEISPGEYFHERKSRVDFYTLEHIIN